MDSMSLMKPSDDSVVLIRNTVRGDQRDCLPTKGRSGAAVAGDFAATTGNIVRRSAAALQPKSQTRSC
jgi:hypothetical protein